MEYIYIYIYIYMYILKFNLGIEQTQRILYIVKHEVN